MDKQKPATTPPSSAQLRPEGTTNPTAGTVASPASSTPPRQEGIAGAAAGSNAQAATVVQNGDGDVTINQTIIQQAAPRGGRSAAPRAARPAPQDRPAPPAPQDRPTTPARKGADTDLLDPLVITGARLPSRNVLQITPDFGDTIAKPSHHRIPQENPVTGTDFSVTGTVQELRGADRQNITGSRQVVITTGNLGAASANTIRQTFGDDYTFNTQGRFNHVDQGHGNDVYAEKNGFKNAVLQGNGNDRAFIEGAQGLHLFQEQGNDTATIVDQKNSGLIVSGVNLALGGVVLDPTETSYLDGGPGYDKLVIQLAPGVTSVRYKEENGTLTFDLGPGEKYIAQSYESVQFTMNPATLMTVHSERGDFTPPASVNYSPQELGEQNPGSGFTTLRLDLPKVTTPDGKHR